MKTLVILALALLAGEAPQPDFSHPWTLTECTRWALENNLTVQQQALTLEQRELDLSTAKGGFLPAISASADENLSFGRGLTADNTYANTNTTSTSFSLGGGMNLFDGLATPSQVKLARLNLEAATADLEKARDDIRVAVAQAYVQILYNYEILEVAQKQIAIDSMQVARLEQMALSGKASGAEVSQQKATAAQSRVTLAQAENQLRLSLLEMAQLLELPYYEGFSVARPAVRIDPYGMIPSADAVFDEAVGIRPAIRADEIRLSATKQSLRIAQAGLYPTLSLSGGIGTNYYTANTGAPQSGFWEQLSNNFSQYVGISLNIPIFSRFQTRNNIRAARLNQESQRIQLRRSKQALYKEIQQAVASAEASRAKFQASELAEEAAADAFRLVQARYENGKAGITEFNESRNQYLKACSDRVQATYEFLYQTRLVEFYRGAVITL